MRKNEATNVEELLDKLDHPLKPALLRLREIVLSADGRLRETVKWNAPSFVLDGEDRVTINIHRGKTVMMVLHRGAKKAAEPFRFEDRSGLAEWRSADRGVVMLGDLASVEAESSKIRSLVAAWVNS